METKRKLEQIYFYQKKVDFKRKTVIRDKEVYLKGIKPTRGYNTCKYSPDKGAPESIKQIVTATKGDIDRNAIIVGEFNTALTLMVRSSRHWS